jgi:GNAT superfamily N-acetyltransferase
MDDIRTNDSGMSVTFSIPIGYSIGVSELSIFPVDAAKDFIEESSLNDAQKALVLEALESSKNIYFYNRLKVPANDQGKGFGTKLLKETLKFIDEKEAFLINTANAYGAKDQEELIKYYQKNGMVLIHDEGGLVYSPLLTPEKVKELENTNKTKNKM